MEERRTKSSLNSGALKEQLWETLIAVKTKKMEANKAVAIAMQAREIMRIVTLEISFIKDTKRENLKNNKFIAP